MSKNPVPEGFAFREFENGPRRDVAREFYELVDRFGWIRQGPEWDNFIAKLLEAREAGLAAALGQLRVDSEAPTQGE